jgi:hypothetical protein
LGELDFEAPASAARPPAHRLPLRFGELDLPLDDDPRPARPVRLPTPGPVRPGGELPEQRIRQIYAQYLETKRSTQESTAGVTFEKLAASLRSQTDRLKSAHPNRSVDYEVVVKDGKTHLKPVLR